MTNFGMVLASVVSSWLVRQGHEGELRALDCPSTIYRAAAPSATDVQGSRRCADRSRRCCMTRSTFAVSRVTH